MGFEYAKDRYGNAYGWGISRYAVPETAFGREFTDHVYAREPEESGQRIKAYLTSLLPQAGPGQIEKLAGKRR